jgi:hypothetical protein
VAKSSKVTLTWLGTDDGALYLSHHEVKLALKMFDKVVEGGHMTDDFIVEFCRAHPNEILTAEELRAAYGAHVSNPYHTIADIRRKAMYWEEDGFLCRVDASGAPKGRGWTHVLVTFNS